MGGNNPDKKRSATASVIRGTAQCASPPLQLSPDDKPNDDGGDNNHRGNNPLKVKIQPQTKREEGGGGGRASPVALNANTLFCAQNIPDDISDLSASLSPYYHPGHHPGHHHHPGDRGSDRAALGHHPSPGGRPRAGGGRTDLRVAGGGPPPPPQPALETRFPALFDACGALENFADFLDPMGRDRDSPTIPRPPGRSGGSPGSGGSGSMCHRPMGRTRSKKRGGGQRGREVVNSCSPSRPVVWGVAPSKDAGNDTASTNAEVTALLTRSLGDCDDDVAAEFDNVELVLDESFAQSPAPPPPPPSPPTEAAGGKLSRGAFSAFSTRAGPAEGGRRSASPTAGAGPPRSARLASSGGGGSAAADVPTSERRSYSPAVPSSRDRASPSSRPPTPESDPRIDRRASDSAAFDNGDDLRRGGSARREAPAAVPPSSLMRSRSGKAGKAPSGSASPTEFLSLMLSRPSRSGGNSPASVPGEGGAREDAAAATAVAAAVAESTGLVGAATATNDRGGGAKISAAGRTECPPPSGTVPTPERRSGNYGRPVVGGGAMEAAAGRTSFAEGIERQAAADAGGGRRGRSDRKSPPPSKTPPARSSKKFLPSFIGRKSRAKNNDGKERRSRSEPPSPEKLGAGGGTEKGQKLWGRSRSKPPKRKNEDVHPPLFPKPSRDAAGGTAPVSGSADDAAAAATKQRSGGNDADVMLWKATADKDTGKTYYYHSKTKEVRWEKPPGFDEAQRRKEALAEQAKCWRKAKDAATGKVYYYHTKTKKVTWTKPEGFRERKKKHKDMNKEARKDGTAVAADPEPVATNAAAIDSTDIGGDEQRPLKVSPSRDEDAVVTIEEAVREPTPTPNGSSQPENPAEEPAEDPAAEAPPRVEDEIEGSPAELEMREVEDDARPNIHDASARLAVELAEQNAEAEDDPVQFARGLCEGAKLRADDDVPFDECAPFDEPGVVVSSHVRRAPIPTGAPPKTPPPPSGAALVTDDEADDSPVASPFGVGPCLHPSAVGRQPSELSRGLRSRQRTYASEMTDQTKRINNTTTGGGALRLNLNTSLDSSLSSWAPVPPVRSGSNVRFSASSPARGPPETRHGSATTCGSRAELDFATRAGGTVSASLRMRTADARAESGDGRATATGAKTAQIEESSDEFDDWSDEVSALSGIGGESSAEILAARKRLQTVRKSDGPTDSSSDARRRDSRTEKSTSRDRDDRSPTCAQSVDTKNLNDFAAKTDRQSVSKHISEMRGGKASADVGGNFRSQPSHREIQRKMEANRRALSGGDGPQKRFGARSQLQHDEISNGEEESSNESSWRSLSSGSNSYESSAADDKLRISTNLRFEGSGRKRLL